ncbi:hypothetical protein EW146_g8869 [Bondarzewia mesenterica]|uniref:Amidohydrolase-related domain-containing protein n=1 Tax=Bondarzewia mesenterica TaxID=1095465 RepID=A0A4S4LAU1_9AGAM|nr:hypothetical protein EW146_g8869 [Bondarzewia mesenterica]
MWNRSVSAALRTPRRPSSNHPLTRTYAARALTKVHNPTKMARGKKKPTIPESVLHLPPPTSGTSTPIVDTHTHLLSTFSAYKSKWPAGAYETVFDFNAWRELADSALTEEGRRELWGGVEYWFVMGAYRRTNVCIREFQTDLAILLFGHPRVVPWSNVGTKRKSTPTQSSGTCAIEAMAHPRCVGWGEIGLDYHYDNSPREEQQAVFTRQLRQAVRLNKPLTIHTREAEEDTERILKAEVPKEHKIHIHCYTDSPELAQRLLAHFPNLYIGITGVITYSSNQNTPALVRQLTSSSTSVTIPPRLILETDAPYMVPSNLYASLPTFKGSRLPLCHTGMIPWTAEFVADLAGEGWDAERVLVMGRENARRMYGV